MSETFYYHCLDCNESSEGSTNAQKHLVTFATNFLEIQQAFSIFKENLHNTILSQLIVDDDFIDELVRQEFYLLPREAYHFLKKHQNHHIFVNKSVYQSTPNIEINFKQPSEYIIKPHLWKQLRSILGKILLNYLGIRDYAEIDLEHIEELKKFMTENNLTELR